MKKMALAGIVGLMIVVALVAGCGGGDSVTPWSPDTISVTVPFPTPSGVISLIGIQEWTVIGDTVDHPVDLVSIPKDAVTFTRIMPGLWRAEAMSSWQCDVRAIYSDEVYWSSHVITTHIRPEKLIISVDGAIKLSDITFDGGKTDLVKGINLTVSWIDQGSSLTMVDNPNIPVLWTVPTGLIVAVAGDKARQICVQARGVGAGPQVLTGDIAGKKFSIVFQTP